jgi:hypothetical protein
MLFSADWENSEGLHSPNGQCSLALQVGVGGGDIYAHFKSTSTSIMSLKYKGWNIVINRIAVRVAQVGELLAGMIELTSIWQKTCEVMVHN